MRLRLFPQSLSGRAKNWYWNDIPDNSVRTWNELKEVFMKKFFPPARTQLFIREISNFTQEDDESLATAFERFKELLRKCPHHGQSDAALVRWFTNGLYYTHQNQLDTMAAGNFLDQPPASCWDMIEKIVNNSSRAHQRGVPRGGEKAKSMLTLSSKDHAEARASAEIFTDRMARMERELEELRKKATVKVVRGVECVTCGGDHAYDECPELKTEKMAFVQGQYNRNSNQSNWQGGANQRSWQPSQSVPPTSQPSSSWQPQGYVNQNREPSLREVVNQLAQAQITSNAQLSQLTQFATQQAKINDAVSSDLKEVKAQLGQVIALVNQREQGKFPSDTVNPRNEHVKSMELRSGREVKNQSVVEKAPVGLPSARKEEPERSYVVDEQRTETEAVPSVRKKVTERSDVVDKLGSGTGGFPSARKEEPERSYKESEQKSEQVYPPPPFPMCLKKRDHEKGLAEFLDHLRKLSITIPFTDALANIPSYAKHLKDLLSNKSKVKLKDVMSTEVVNVMMDGELPPKLKDQGAFNIPCRIGDEFEGQALCDLGASINLMPLSTFQKLSLGELKRTLMKISLADCSVMSPCGVVEDVLVRVDGLIIPTDFIVCKIKEDKDVPLIFGRPFLATGQALIDVQKGEVTFRVKGREVTFNVHSGAKCSSKESCCAINGVVAENKVDEKGYLDSEYFKGDQKPPDLNPVLSKFDDEVIDVTNILSLSNFSGRDVKKDKSHVDEKQKFGIRVKMEKDDLVGRVELYIPPHRRLDSSEKDEVDGKEVIK